MSKDARQKLRDMGGIMASSPELMQAVQKFNNGGPIMPPAAGRTLSPAPFIGYPPGRPFPFTPPEHTLDYRYRNITKYRRPKTSSISGSLPSVESVERNGPIMPMPPRGPSGPNFAPRMPPAPMAGIRPSSLQVPPLAGTLPVVPRDVSLREDVMNSPELRRQVLAASTPSFGTSQTIGDVDRAPPNDAIMDLVESSESSTAKALEIENMRKKGTQAAADFVMGLPDPAQALSKYAAIFGAELAGSIASFMGATETGAKFFDIADVNRRASAPLPLDEETAETPMGGPRRGAVGPTRSVIDRNVESLEGPEETQSPEQELSPEETIMAQPLVPEEINDETLDRMRKLVESDPNITPPPPGGGDDKPTKRDLRSRYNDQLALMQEIYGLEDKDEAQERAMSLAMIGLAIAAGQSPNALTNIAQGAMVGLQGMGERRDAARERERGIKTLALQTAIDQQAAEAEAEAEAAKMDLEQRNRLELEEYKARVGAMYGGAGGSRDARNIIDFTQNTYTEALKAASAMTAPDFDPDTETPHQYAMRQAQQAAESMGRMFPGYGGLASPDAPAVPEIPTITTREEYDALPSGTKFMQNGQERIKP